MGKLLMFLKWNRFQIFLDAIWAQLWIVKPLLYAWEDASAQFILDKIKTELSAPVFYVCGAGGKSPASFAGEVVG